ncbi:MAG: hypothetical protein IJD88_04720 [Clostridia bacterium]|nr:hypothetical protein [Clostridia bacterium]MBQ4604054.1 hypothetical protein [Clostridia bacterium]
MGSEQMFKKSMLGGFKKEGVLNYIEQLQTEIIELKKEISNKPDFSDELEFLKAKNEDAISEAASMSAKYDALKAENEALSERNSELLQELDDAKKMISDYENKQCVFEQKIAVIENKFAQLAGGFSVNSESSYGSKFGDAVENAKTDIYDANERIKTACNNLECSSSALKSSVDSLLNILADISENLITESDRVE